MAPIFTVVSKVSFLLQAMLSNKTVEANDGSNPCIEISDIKFEIFTVRHEIVGFLREFSQKCANNE